MQYEKLRKVIRKILEESNSESKGLSKNASYSKYFKELKSGKTPEEAYEEANREFEIFQLKNPDKYSNYSGPNTLKITREIIKHKSLKDFKDWLKSVTKLEPNPNLAKIPVSKRTRKPYNRTVLIPKADIFKEKTKDMGAYIDIATYIGDKEGKNYWTEEGLGWWEEEGHKMIDLFSENELDTVERFHLDKDTYYRLPYKVKNK